MTKSKISKKTTPKKEVVLTKEDFLKSLNKVILTVKVPKSPVKGKKKTSA
jgi:hypothetical protein